MKKIKLFQFSKGRTDYVENSKESTKQLLALVSELTQVTG